MNNLFLKRVYLLLCLPGGQEFPGYLQFGQHSPVENWQIAHVSSEKSQSHFPTACQCLIFICKRPPLLTLLLTLLLSSLLLLLLVLMVLELPCMTRFPFSFFPFFFFLFYSSFQCLKIEKINLLIN